MRELSKVIASVRAAHTDISGDLPDEIDELILHVNALKSQCDRWESKEIRRATCCMRAENLIKRLADNGVEAAQDFLAKNAREWESGE